MIKIMLLLLVLSSCSVLPDYDIRKVEYCKRMGNVVYCKDSYYDTGYYYSKDVE